MSGDIVDLIDGALDDYLSADAMRWAPEPDLPKTALPAPALGRVVTVDFDIDTSRFVRALVQAAEALSRLPWDRMARILASIDMALEPPRNGPRPLSIDGHAYRRRARGRRRGA